MDYLDPKKKKAKKNKLMIMYILLGVAISIATVVMVYLVNGYTIDRESGQVIQNALLYLDTKPESADIYLNGEKQRGKTDARLVLGEGVYDIEMKRDGYMPWKRKLVLEGGSLRRLTYARLVPEKLETQNIFELSTLPSMVTQSVDKRWVVMASNEDPLKFNYIDLGRPELQLQQFGLSANTVKSSAKGTWKVLDWADDHRTFLGEYKTKTTTEYVLVDRERPDLSRKLAEVFANTAFTSASLRNRKSNLVFLHDAKSGTLYRGDAGNGRVEKVLEGVVQYVAFGDDSILFMTEKDAPKGKVDAKLLKGEKTYKLRSLTKDSSYLLALSKLGNALVAGVSSPVENRAIIYNDPIKALEQNDFSDIPVPTTVLQLASPTSLTISADSSVIIAQGGQYFASHEFEADRSYTFKVARKVDPKHVLKWVDGQHFFYKPADNKALVFSDFDGSNQYNLTNSTSLLSGIFDSELDSLFTFAPASKTSKPQLVKTFMRTTADR